MIKKGLASGIVILLVSTALASGISIYVDVKPDSVIRKISTVGGNHSPIYINGNENFTSENGVTGGNGTEKDPYIIEKWAIKDNGSTENGIFVNNTDAYFIIKNCNVSNFRGEFESGIRFSQVENGRIEGVYTYRNYFGIRIEGSVHIEISSSSCHHNYGWYATGIYCGNSLYVTITSCECYNNIGQAGTGINLFESSHCLIENSRCYNNSVMGIDIDSIKGNPCAYNIIKNCQIYNNEWGGIEINAIGVRLAQPGYNHIIGCEVYDNGHPPGIDNAIEGILIFQVSNNVVEDCEIYGNGEGIQIGHCSNNIIRNCSIYGNWMPTFAGVGVLIVGDFGPLPRPELARNNIIEHCDIYNQEIGIWLYESLRSKVRKNNIFNNSWKGLNVNVQFGINTALINYNNICNNGLGVEIGRGIYVEPFCLVNARHNWWNSPDGPGYRGPGTGDDLEWFLSIVLYKPWATEPIPDAGVQ